MRVAARHKREDVEQASALPTRDALEQVPRKQVGIERTTEEEEESSAEAVGGRGSGGGGIEPCDERGREGVVRPTTTAELP